MKTYRTLGNDASPRAASRIAVGRSRRRKGLHAACAIGRARAVLGKQPVICSHITPLPCSDGI